MDVNAGVVFDNGVYLDELDQNQTGDKQDTAPSDKMSFVKAILQPHEDVVIGTFEHGERDLSLSVGSLASGNYKSYVLIKGSTYSIARKRASVFYVKIGTSANPKFVVTQVEDYENLPASVKAVPRVEKLVGLKIFWKVSMTVKSNGVVTENLYHSEPLWHQAEIDQIRDIFRPQNVEGSQTIQCYVACGDTIEQTIDRIPPLLEQEREDDPVWKWHPGKKKIFLQLGTETPVADRPRERMAAITTFANWEEYLTLKGYAVIQEKEHTEGLAGQISLEQKELKLMHLPGAGDRLYLAFLSAEQMQNLPKLQPGDHLKVHMDPEKIVLANAWDGFVLDSLPLAAVGDVTFQLLRPRQPKPDQENEDEIDEVDIENVSGSDTDMVDDTAISNVSSSEKCVSDSRGPFVELAVDAGDFKYATDKDARSAYDDLPTRTVNLELVNSDKPFRQQIAALGKIHNVIKSDSTPHLHPTTYEPQDDSHISEQMAVDTPLATTDDERVQPNNAAKDIDQLSKERLQEWVSILLGQSTEVASTTDFFEGIKKKPLQKLALSASQSLVISHLRSISNKLGIIQGPPGTGKTFTAVEILMPLLAFTDQQILVVSSSNSPADEFVLKLTSRWDSYNSKAKRSCMIVRLHAASSEKEYVQKHARPVQTEKDSRIDLKAAEAEIGELLTARFIHEHIRKSTKTAHIADKRFVLAEQSLAMVMLKVAGVVEHEWSEPASWLDFRSAYGNRQREGELGKMKGNDALLVREHNSLKEAVFRKARVIAGTISAMADGHLRENVNPTWILVEECARASEPELLTLIAAFPQVKGIICIGDQRQLRPMVISKGENNLSSQLSLALPTRLVQLGHQSIMLTEQHRMVSGTTAFINKSFYDGRLIDALSTAIDTRPIALAMRKFFQDEYGMAPEQPPLMFLSVESGNVIQNHGGTRINLQNVGYAIKVIARILTKCDQVQPSDICVLTLYQGQYKIYKSVFRQLSKEGYENINLRKVDGFQGGEASIVILDLVFRGAPGFVKDPNRLNVGLTRHRDALIVIGHIHSLERAKEWDKRYLRNLATTFLETQQLSKIYDTGLAEHEAITNSIRQDQREKEGAADKTEEDADIVCRHCEQPGHMAKDCPDPAKAITCRRCEQPGHMAKDCPDPAKAITCRRCEQTGHMAKDCPKPKVIMCNNCKVAGHKAANCNETCGQCGDYGHVVSYCPDIPGAIPQKRGIGEHTKEDVHGEWNMGEATATWVESGSTWGK
ncbi:MAG: Tripartite DNA replication factor [Sclerophora amabilis]|nr:MAG: Tripartite DNA replication factor [Sclerophora amabilis]